VLKKPYIKFYERDYNNYYLIQVGQIFYLAIESILPYNSSGLFSKQKELQQALKLLPIYSPILLTLTSLVQQEKTGEQELEGVGKEEIFTEVSISDVRKKIAELTNQTHDESKFNFKKAIKAPTVRKIMEESNFSLLMRQDLDTFKSVYWIAKSDKFGKLTIHEITTAGRDEEKLMVMNSYFLDRELVSSLLIKMQEIQIKQDKLRLKNLKKEHKKMLKHLPIKNENNENNENEGDVIND
jgi:hypothetical protein